MKDRKHLERSGSTHVFVLIFVILLDLSVALIHQVGQQSRTQFRHMEARAACKDAARSALTVACFFKTCSGGRMQSMLPSLLCRYHRLPRECLSPLTVNRRLFALMDGSW